MLVEMIHARTVEEVAAELREAIAAAEKIAILREELAAAQYMEDLDKFHADILRRFACNQAVNVHGGVRF